MRFIAPMLAAALCVPASASAFVDSDSAAALDAAALQARQAASAKQARPAERPARNPVLVLDEPVITVGITFADGRGTALWVTGRIRGEGRVVKVPVAQFDVTRTGYGFSVGGPAVWEADGVLLARFLKQQFRLGAVAADRTLVFSPDISLFNGVFLHNETRDASGWRAHVSVFQKTAP